MHRPRELISTTVLPKSVLSGSQTGSIVLEFRRSLFTEPVIVSH